MSSVIDRINKRAFYPLALPNGETVHVCGLRREIINEASAFREDEESVGFVIGYGLLNDDRSPVFTKLAGETAKEFGLRVLQSLGEMGPDVREAIVSKIFLCTNEPSKVAAEAIIKN